MRADDSAGGLEARADVSRAVSSGASNAGKMASKAGDSAKSAAKHGDLTPDVKPSKPDVDVHKPDVDTHRPGVDGHKPDANVDAEGGKKKKKHKGLKKLAGNVGGEVAGAGAGLLAQLTRWRAQADALLHELRP